MTLSNAPKKKKKKKIVQDSHRAYIMIYMLWPGSYGAWHLLKPRAAEGDREVLQGSDGIASRYRISLSQICAMTKIVFSEPARRI